MAKIGPYEVTEEKLQDIYAGRVRLAAFKASIETYPPWPEDEAPTFEHEGNDQQAFEQRLDELESILERPIYHIHYPHTPDVRDLRENLERVRKLMLDHIKAKEILKSNYVIKE